MPHFRLATWNVHNWVGVDKKHSPRRAMTILGGLDADVLALQEASLPQSEDFGPPRAFLERHTGMHAGVGFTLLRKDAHFGNALLSRLPFTLLRNHDISFKGREPRGIIEAVVEKEDAQLQILATHLGLRMRERRIQMQTILDLAKPERYGCVALMGDFNEWLPAPIALRQLRGIFDAPAAPRTFPSRLPLLALDRIMVTKGGRLETLTASREGEAAQASDHLPLLADLHID